MANPSVIGDRELRDSGIKLIGAVPWGTHFCQFYRTKQDLIDVLVPYFRSGLERNEFCMWITSAPLHAGEARSVLAEAVPDLERRMKAGQIEVLDYSEWYAPGGRFDADRVLAGWVQKELQALARGFEGLRLTGNTFWLEKRDWQTFSDYEAAVDDVIGAHRMLALCTYSVDRCGAFEVIDVVNNHEFALIQQEGAWQVIESRRHRKTRDELRRSEESIWAHQRLIDTIFDSILAHVAYLDRDFNFERVNATYARGSGYRAEDLIGRNHFDLFPSEENLAIFRRVRDTGEPYVVRAKPFDHPSRPEDTTFWDWWLYPIRSSNGSVQGVVLSLVDVTPLVSARQEVERLNAELSQANAAKDHFLAVLSHELRTPLTPALISAGALEADPALPEPVRREAGVIRSSIELETRLIDDLLDLTRISRAKLQIRPEPTDLHETVRGVLAMCAADVDAKGLRIETRLEAKDPSVLADPARLHQVLWNLVKNAIKFTPQGGSVTVSTRAGSSGAVLEVRDTGMGIDPELLPRIFEPFEQGSGGEARRAGGLGLGLAITRSLVEMHHGRIEARSEGQGRGSVFTIEWPRAPERPAVAGEPRAAATPTEVPNVRILIVEDDRTTAYVMSRLLAMWGHAVETAGSVQAALDLLAAGDFDLLISDLGLPDGSGLELMRRVRADSDIRGIALSGYGMDTDVDQSRQAGFDLHLTKPVSIDLLQNAIEKVLADRAGAT